MAAKLAFTEGTTAREARGKVAEDLKREGRSNDSAFAIATAITKRAGAAGRKRLARRGVSTR
jgi:hypothetical protein